MLIRLRHLRCLELDVSDWEPAPTNVPALRALTYEIRLYCPSIVTVVYVYDFERYLVRMVDHVATYDEEAETENLWREM